MTPPIHRWSSVDQEPRMAAMGSTKRVNKPDMVALGAQPGTMIMAYDAPPPKKLPEPGYYYHFKHDADGPLNNYAYYIYGVGHHTEDDCRTEDAFMQVYRPLYEEAYAYRNGGLFDLRPLHMFYQLAEWKGKEVPRFTRIVDRNVIAQLEAIKSRMYPNL